MCKTEQIYTQLTTLKITVQPRDSSGTLVCVSFVSCVGGKQSVQMIISTIPWRKILTELVETSTAGVDWSEDILLFLVSKILI